MVRWIRRLRRAAALPARERGDLARAQAALLAAQLRVWTRPAGRLLYTHAAPEAPAAAPAEAEHARRLARAVDRAAAAGAFRPTCLVRALALHRLLAAEGLRGGAIRIGVCGDRPPLRAHAWVEFRGVALGDDGVRAGGFHPLALALPADAERGG